MGCYFPFFFPSQFFLTEVFFNWLTLVQLLDPMHASCTGLVHIVCTLCKLSLVAALNQLRQLLLLPMNQNALWNLLDVLTI